MLIRTLYLLIILHNNIECFIADKFFFECATFPNTMLTMKI